MVYLSIITVTISQQPALPACAGTPCARCCLPHPTLPCPCRLMQVALKVARSRAVQDERASCNYTFDEFLGVEVASYTRIGAVGSASSISTSGIPCVYAYGKHIFAPAADTEAPWVVISFMAMQLLGQSVWRCMREQRLFVHDSGSEDDPIDDGSSQASGSGKQWQPSRAWVVKTGKGMLKVRMASRRAWGASRGACSAGLGHPARMII